MSWKIALANLVTDAGMKLLQQEIDKILAEAANLTVSKVVEFKNETDLELDISGDTTMYLGRFIEAPDATVSGQEMEVYGIESGLPGAVQGYTIYSVRTQSVSFDLLTGFNLPVKLDILNPNRLQVCLGDPGTMRNVTDGDVRTCSWANTTAAEVERYGYRLTGVMGDRAIEYTLKKIS